MSFDYQRPTPISFREGRQAMSSAVARASQRKLNLQLKMMEQQRAAQAKQVKAQTDELKRRQGQVDGIDFNGMTLDGRNNLMASLSYLDENMANMSATEFRTYVRQLKSNISQDQQWYKQANTVYAESLEMMDPIAREAKNNKLDGKEVVADTEDHRRKSILLESPISARNDFQGEYDPATLSYVTPDGRIPITNGLYTPPEVLGPTTRDLIQHSSLTDIYNSQKKGGAQEYGRLMYSPKTEDRKPEYYDQTAANAYNDTIWKKAHNRRTLLQQYNEEENTLSSDVMQVIMDQRVSSKISALELANSAGLPEDQVKQINDLYDWGMNKTKEWGMQRWRGMKESSGGSGSGSGSSDGLRRPKIEESFMPNVSDITGYVTPDVSDLFNISERGGLLAFDTPQKVNNTIRDFGLDATNKQLDLYAFGMDKKYRLIANLGVPTVTKKYKVYSNVYDTLEAANNDPLAGVGGYEPEEIESYEVIPKLMILRPKALINADNEIVGDEYKTSPSKEDDMYKNILMQIAYQQATPKKQAELGEEGLLKLAFKYLTTEFGL